MFLLPTALLSLSHLPSLKIGLQSWTLSDAVVTVQLVYDNLKGVLEHTSLLEIVLCKRNSTNIGRMDKTCGQCIGYSDMHFLERDNDEMNYSESRVCGRDLVTIMLPHIY